MAGKHNGRSWYKIQPSGTADPMKEPEKGDPIRRDPSVVRAYSTQGAVIKHKNRNG